MYSSKKVPVAPSARNHWSAGATTADAAWPAAKGPVASSRYIARSTTMSWVAVITAETSVAARASMVSTEMV